MPYQLLNMHGPTCFKNDDPEPLRRMFETKQAAIEMLAKSYMEPGAPDLIAVTEPMHDAFRAAAYRKPKP